MEKHQNCIYCGKQILNKGSLVSHQKRCLLNPNRVEYKVGLRKYGNNKTGTSWSKGLTKETSEILFKKAERLKQHIKELKKQGKPGYTGMGATEETQRERRRKISEAAKRNHRGGYKRCAGRGKKGWYKGYWCDSSWELAFVIYNLEHDIKFERNNQGFEYEFNNQKYNFYPDFIMEDGTYVEIKGVLTEQNKVKIQTFSKNHNLIVIGESEISQYLNYVTNKYSKNFVQMYDVQYKPKARKKKEEKNINII